MNNEPIDDPAVKIAMLKASMRCFAFGLLAFLPGIGIPFAVAALWTAGQVRRYEKEYWNAAGSYRIWGIVCAALGLIFWFGVAGLIALNAVTSGDSDGGGLYGGGGE